MKRLVARSVSTFRTFQPRMLDFVLVRHGESEGNTAYDRSRAGDHSLYSGDFLTRHSSQWRLTERGRWQAKKAGAWIMKNMDCNFHRYYTSEYSRFYFRWDYPIYGSAAACAVHRYFRAMETAALLGLPNARWFTEVRARPLCALQVPCIGRR